jgi:uncharacterized repeat protein (TIGR01451 family)
MNKPALLEMASGVLFVGRGGASLARRVFAVLLFSVATLAAFPVSAEDCSEFFGGVLDGNVTPAPSQIQIDRNCTIRNFPASNPLTTNFSFLTQPGQTNERWLIIFDNVVHTGEMACNSVAGHKIWFTNGSSSTIQENCQNLLIPVEKIDKQNPAGDTATIGVPFTYRLTMPVLFDPATGAVINTSGSLNDLHGVTVIDDLDATGVDLTYLSHVAYWEDSGAPVSHTFVEAAGRLTFDNFPIIPAGRQIVVEITVVLEDTLANTIGKQFINTAKWDFGRLIDGVFYEPLPGEWGVTQPMTIVGPNLVMTKGGPATLNLGESGDFTLDIQNTGNSDAWNATILDRLPNGPGGGMCDLTPQVLGAQVFAADGVTPVPGKGPLILGSDYSLSYDGAPTCELTLTVLTAAATVGPGERLIINYRTELDTDSSNGVTLTNVAGATQWFHADVNTASRQTYTRTLTNGTTGTPDHEDAHTVSTALTGYFFEKSVENLTSGAIPTAVATPGDTLRYSLRLRTTDTPLSNLTFYDDLGELNASPVFVPGSLTLVAGGIPAGAIITNTDPNGGTNGAGILDVRNLSVAADSEILIQFDITLAPVLANGLVVLNQADLISAGEISKSDDPNVNGLNDPNVPGDEDPTQVQIQSAPYFDVDKISTILDGDPAILLAGERLRYTLTVKNIGTDDAVDARLRDALPANTTYVAGSATLNGTPLADGAGETFPLSEGVDLYTPEDPTPGALRADASATTDNVATIQFDVVVASNVADGTVIANQAFVSALAGGVVDQPSDDPRTEVVDDPTRNVVGNYPLIYAEKAAALLVDDGAPGSVDPGDYLRYTIVVHNNGPVAATMVRLADVAPTDTTYAADTLTLNGLPVGQPDDGVFPLEAGIWLSSADLTPPVPGPSESMLTPGEAATIGFDVRVDDAVPRGTLITNQATVTTEELGDLLTDGDGNPATGPEPTVVVVGDAQQLGITKQVLVVDGGPALAGAVLEYVVTVENTGVVPAVGVYVTDNLDEPTPGQLLYVDGSATLNGVAVGISVAGGVITANYSAQYGALEPGQSFVLRFRAQIDPDLPIGATITNVAHVTWNTDQTASATVSIDVGGMVGSGTLNGVVWHDANFDDAADGTERVLEGWLVELRRNDQLIHTATTDAAGVYQIAGVSPNYLTQDQYELTFRAPDAAPATALLGLADSDYTNDLQRISDIIVLSGSNLQDLNLPIDPNGVVYESIARTPVANATLTMLNASTDVALPDACFDDPAQQGQVTRGDGYYKFDINFSDPSCPSGGTYVIALTEPGTTFESGYSTVIPPARDATMLPFDVPGCPGGIDDVITATVDHCEIQPSEFAPGSGVPAQSVGTTYHVRLLLADNQVPGSSQLFNNHIPLDPLLAGVVTISKTTPMVNVTRGQMVPYTITVGNTRPVDLANVDLIDRYPVGFKYIEGSARLDGEPLEPVWADRQLVWENLTLTAEGGQVHQPGPGATQPDG